jgi:tetratricopeptide (TPR) repeat protein
MSYWTYYLAWLFLAYGIQQPWLLGGVVVFLLLRRWIPDPGALFRALHRGSALRAQVNVNPANVTARRDLAMIYLDLLRPRSALALVDEALARDPDSAELLYLKGVALHRLGRQAEALEPLVRAVALNPTLRWGEPYRIAGDALFALGRCEEAIDSYERLARINSSDVGVHTLLARAHAKAGDRDAARAEVYAALETFHQIPTRMRRRAFTRWLAAQRLRVTLLHEPLAIGVAVAMVALFGGGLWYGTPLVRRAMASPARTVVRTAADPRHRQPPAYVDEDDR